MEQNTSTLPNRPSTLAKLAKLNRPWLPAVFLRERLFQRLDEGANRPCIWIGAPGGYGKTTLAASYVEARRIPCLWYQLDEDDADPATFFYYLGIAADTLSTGPSLPLLTPEYQSDLPAFARRYFRALFQRVAPPCILLFDNYHRLPAAAPLHALLAGDRPAALRHLAAMRPWIRATNSHLGAFLRTLAAAQFALAWGRQQARCLRRLRRALALGRAEGYIFFPFFKPDDMARLCAAALDAGIEVEYVQTLIRKRGLLPDPSAAISERWPWPVRLYVLGRFGLVVDDRPVNFGRKAQHKPLELLKIIIAWGGRDVSQAQIADALWPDADGDAGQQALTTTLHRLRRLLGHDQALCLRDGRLSLDSRYCWVDVWCLERRISQALARLRESDGRSESADLASAVQHILHAYQGPFLGQEPEAWALQTRDHLRDRYLKCLEEVGTHLEAASNWEMAKACYKRGLEAAPASERCSRGLARCRGQAGNGAVATVARR